MANEQNLKNWEKGVSGNPKGRPKGALGRATIVKQWMEAKQSLKNPISGELEMLSQPIFNKLDIDVIEDDSSDEDSEITQTH